MDIIKFSALVSWLTHKTGYHFGDFDITDMKSHIETMNNSNAVAATQINGILQAIKEDKKIEAIKQYRAATGFGLKEAKDAIEAHWPTEHQYSKPRIWCEKIEITGDYRMYCKLRDNHPTNGATRGDYITTSAIKMIDFERKFAVTQNHVYYWI